MKKPILLLMCIISSISIHTMENSFWSLSINSCKSFFSELISGPQIPSESSLIIALRKNVNEFENVLQSISHEESKIRRTLLLMLALDNEVTKPSTFLNCCYYYKYWEKDERMMSLNNLLSLDLIVLKKYENAQIKGYSVFGASMIAKDVSFAKRRMLIQELSNHNFKPTLKDIGIAELILYEGALKHREKLMHLCNPDSKANWFALPKDLRLQIAYYIIRILKNEFWLLPE